jgi:hypothetical protein
MFEKNDNSMEIVCKKFREPVDYNILLSIK